MSNKVKVGDKVVYTGENMCDLTNGKEYTVNFVYEEVSGFNAIDDVGEENDTISDSFILLSTTPNNYTRILEAMLTEDQITMAKRIAGVV